MAFDFDNPANEHDKKIKKEIEKIIETGPTRIIKTSKGDVTVKIPIWEDYVELLSRVPPKIQEMKIEDPDYKRQIMLFSQRYVAENWIVNPKFNTIEKNPSWAVSLLKVSLEMLEPFMELLELKKN